jgi:hypothetical protein
MAISTKSQSLRLYRNTDILESREEAVKAITAELSERRIDGEFMIVRYFCNKGDEQRPNFVIETILGVAAYDSHSVKTFVTIFDMDNIDNNIETLRIDMETAIASEAQARQEADDAINATINDTIIPTINQEIQDRKDADDALLTTINNEIKTAIEKEIEDRTQADDELRENVLNNEEKYTYDGLTQYLKCERDKGTYTQYLRNDTIVYLDDSYEKVSYRRQVSVFGMPERYYNSQSFYEYGPYGLIKEYGDAKHFGLNGELDEFNEWTVTYTWEDDLNCSWVEDFYKNGKLSQRREGYMKYTY